ncbi:hypothetical protein [Capnocytophaga catalasegens]|uniref:Uncharacterized protein n=1 Tax=Capnocytophaga catalasegens TaxID=1004260 RepID=A0AAV5ASD1_9FLAO|nr:hypothetical protein [Capnocytophaga catalasegens]GIZ16104.1 hypothetical protein RCZ03_21040 [Capnocytophaga catalasegens]GJM50263.1 hypothetical protein RCZ15_12360 [Capnocytophaga catalasegens]GJM53494.1 hypothetical protein RCZ16_18100 [Capnocytophaga catalasegens]
MSYAGHIIDMIKRINTNNSLKKAHRARNNKRNASLTYKTSENQFINDDIPPEVLEEIKLNICTKIKKEQQKETFLVIFVFCSVLLFLALFLYIIS